MTGISINKIIYQLLSEDEELSRLVSGQISPLVAKETTAFPFVLFKKNNVIPTYTKDGNVTDTISVSISIASTGYFENIEIAERIRAILENRRAEGIRSMRLVSVIEDYIDDTFVQELEFEIKI